MNKDILKRRMSEEEIGMKVHYVKFVYDGDSYMAFGESEIGMQVYKESKPRLYVRHGGVTWPGWTKYMDWDMDLEVTEEGHLSFQEFKDKIGVFMSREFFEYAITDGKEKEK